MSKYNLMCSVANHPPVIFECIQMLWSPGRVSTRCEHRCVAGWTGLKGFDEGLWLGGVQVDAGVTGV